VPIRLGWRLTTDHVKAAGLRTPTAEKYHNHDNDDAQRQTDHQQQARSAYVGVNGIRRLIWFSPIFSRDTNTIPRPYVYRISGDRPFPVAATLTAAM
jgi:hypothetical protein